MLEQKYPETFTNTCNKTQKADISHYHTVDPQFYLSTYFKKKRGVKIGYVHFLPETLVGSIQLSPLIQLLFNRYVISFYKKMDKLVVVNPSFIEKLVSLGIAKDKITYIPNFVSEATFYQQSVEEKRQWRLACQYQPHEFVILGIGQIQERKGIDDFVQLAQQNPMIKFIWAGGFSFGKMTAGYRKYKQIVSKPPKNLFFTGIIERDKLNGLYNMADLFLLPSYNELFP